MDEPYRPVALRVMAEWMERDPVWDSHPDHVGPVELADLGVSGELVERLRAWNARFNARAGSDYQWLDDEHRKTWQAFGLRLAYALQNELPDVEISYRHDGDVRPLRQRRGP
ncbi:hypothetical protein [Kineococcus rubinsiae]|uniref:hypothetical protein n=1 Tax=Kineococcus rubinsiae TaxID=2609562 RepID=UPI00143106EE|nr:hypothetical protein [Kineococcus rubinsiae]NIZ90946.1 hypothetical protein [Kineococcus rubinsiae]